MRNKIKVFHVVCMLVLWIGYYASMQCFMHTHYYGGYKVTHQHPYRTATHQHSSVELSYIAAFTSTEASMASTTCLPPFYYSLLYTIDIARKVSLIKVFTRAYISLRAPPVAVCCS